MCLAVPRMYEFPDQTQNFIPIRPEFLAVLSLLDCCTFPLTESLGQGHTKMYLPWVVGFLFPPLSSRAIFPLVITSFTGLSELGCCNRVSLSSLHNRHLFLTVLGLELWDQGVSMAGFWWELSSWLTDGCLLAVFSHERERAQQRDRDRERAPDTSSRKDTNPSRGSTLMTSSESLTSPYGNTVTFTSRFGGNINIQLIKVTPTPLLRLLIQQAGESQMVKGQPHLQLNGAIIVSASWPKHLSTGH